MKALVFQAPERAEVVDVDRPVPGAGEVIVRSRAVGICHSDFELYEGRYIIPVRYPVVPGHEWCGEVAELGPDVSGLKVGDRVVGECVVGPEGRDHFGFSIDGANAEFFRARAEWLHVLPEELSDTAGALVEPFSVAYAAARAAGRIDPSDRVAVIGGGPIGLLCVAAAAGGNAPVTMIEPQSSRRAFAIDLGARQALDPTEAGFAERVAELNRGRGFDVVIEAAGAPAAMASALELAGIGARVVFVGISIGNPTPADLGLIQSKALAIRGIIGSAGLWPQTIRFLASGAVDPTAIVTAQFPLADALAALRAARDTAANVKVHIQSA
ncbi:MAG TPA: zinc-binding dehydrogenase [Solirubrobacteraceae bacterium]|nr:zinc-binding dehydrogenase [Solirubrobacteraceae bacterium]